MLTSKKIRYLNNDISVNATMTKQVWSFDKLQSYLSENEDVPEDWVSTALTVCSVCCVSLYVIIKFSAN